MVTYLNGQVPLSVVSVVLGSGYDSKGRYWEHRLTPAMAQRWAAAQAYSQNKWGRKILIRAGANAYRDLNWQKIARADECAKGNCNGAAVPGTSSHGGNWRSRDCLAIDVHPNGLSWAQVWEACRSAGFECGLITQAISGIPGGEPWHIIDFAAFAAPAGGGSVPFPEEDMDAVQNKKLDETWQNVGIIKQLLAETVQWDGLLKVAGDTLKLVGQIHQAIYTTDTASEGDWKGINETLGEIHKMVATILAAGVSGDGSGTAPTVEQIADELAARLQE